MNENFYYSQARLLLKILPLINKFSCFALKGGTAINFFIRDLPRLSVDIDLTYLPVRERSLSLQDISQSLKQISLVLTRSIPNMKVIYKTASDTNTINALIANQQGITVKIESNVVMRGSVFPAEKRSLCKMAEQKFKLTTTASTLSFADLYGSKICAALDRQHPRDFFDVHLLLTNEGITEEIRKAFIVYLISHPRPIVELLDPAPKDISEIYIQELEGITFEKVTLKEITETQNHLIKSIKNLLTVNEQRFLISFKSRNPDWDLLGLKNIDELPAVKWKLLNIKKMNKTKHTEAVNKLEKFLEL